MKLDFLHTTEICWLFGEEWHNDVGTALEGNAGGNRYFLFCNGDYEVKKKSSDQAQDTQGDILIDKATSNKITIAQAFPNINFRSFAPYWIQSVGIYVVDKKSHDPAAYRAPSGWHSTGRVIE
jgi:hypothetical protein